MPSMKALYIWTWSEVIALETVITALITGCLALTGVILTCLSSNRKMYLDPSLWQNEDPKSLEDYRKEFFENFNK